MSWPLRLVLLPAIAAAFYPDLMVEVAGVAVMVLGLAGNWLASRREAGLSGQSR
jgi:hypothetical protein